MNKKRKKGWNYFLFEPAKPPNSIKTANIKAAIGNPVSCISMVLPVFPVWLAALTLGDVLFPGVIVPVIKTLLLTDFESQHMQQLLLFQFLHQL